MTYVIAETCIDVKDDVPAEWKQYTAVNAEFFTEEIAGYTSPGGAAQVGPTDRDHPVVAGFEAPA